VIALVIGGIALGAAGGGTVFGLQARSSFDKAKQTCGMIDHCPEDQLQASQKQVNDARTSATLSTALFIGAGGVAVVAAIVWATAPSLERKTIAVAPTVGSGTVGLALGGAF
jgi:hypothetical protein